MSSLTPGTPLETLSLVLDTELDSIDRQIIWLITRGHTTSYSIWSAMKNEAKVKHSSKKVLAHKNLHQRAINLAKAGYLSEFKLEEGINMYGRRDYKVTMKGMQQLVFHIILYPKDLKSIIDYMDKIKLDKMPFETFLFNMFLFTQYALEVYKKYTNADIEVEREYDRITKIRHGGYSLKRPSKQ